MNVALLLTVDIGITGYILIYIATKSTMLLRNKFIPQVC